jgi:4-aminobutyrate aminotransferase-like enzyme
MMPTTEATRPSNPSAEKSHGQDLRDSATVKDAIDTLVSEVVHRSEKITAPRGPIPGFSECYEELMKRAAAVRGRGLLSPYIGSGIGNGALVELADGSVRWDMICGIGVYFFGHSDPDLIAASLRGALDDTLKQGNLQSNWEPYSFSETLVAEARKNSPLRYAFATTSGVMANENALKVCYQKHAPASRVIAFRDCFMGRTVTMSQIGDAPAYRVGIPLTTAVDYMPFFDPAEAGRVGKGPYIEGAVRRLREYIDRYPGQHACFIFELVQGEGGFNVGDRDFFKALMDVCKKHKIAVWDDEIQTFGRLPRMFAYEHFDLGQYVDVLTVGKMTQACATLYTEEYNPGPGLLSGTFLGDGVSFRVGQRVIERLRDGQYYGDKGSITRNHALFRTHVKDLATRQPDWFPAIEGVSDIVGGVGGMMRFTPFGGNKDKITRACKTIFEEGVVLFYAGHGPYHLRMLPPMGVMREQDWPDIFACIERGLARIAGE